MGNKVFRTSYYIYFISLVILLLLSVKEIISFGVDVGNSLTQVMIIIGLVVSQIIYFFVNRVKAETTAINIIRGILILIMLLIVGFLINDFK